MAGSDPRIPQLQKTALFGALSEETVALVLEKAPRVAREAGEYFVREGERGSSLFWLEAGSVAVVQQREGREVEVRRLRAGDCFGEMAQLDLGSRSASVRALEPCRALEISSRLVREIGRRDLEQLTLFTMNIGRELSRRLRST